MAQFQHCLNRLLYDLTLCVHDLKLGVGPTLVHVGFDSETEAATPKDLYLYLIQRCEWLTQKPKLPVTSLTIGPTLLAQLKQFSFDEPVRDFEVSVLLQVYSKYRVEDNIHFLVADYLCFEHVPTFLLLVPKRTPQVWVDVNDVENFQHQVRGLLETWAGTHTSISFEDLVDVVTSKNSNDKQKFLARGYTKEILNSILLLCSNTHQKVQYKRLALRHANFNERSVSVELKRPAAKLRTKAGAKKFKPST